MSDIKITYLHYYKNNNKKKVVFEYFKRIPLLTLSHIIFVHSKNIYFLNYR